MTTEQLHRLHPLTPVLRGWKVFAAAVALALQQVYNNDVPPRWLFIGIAASIPVAAVYGYLSRRFTHYVIAGGDLRLETGVLFRRSRRVRIDRLQAVDVVRPLVGRALGLAELRLEVAGGSSAEAPLAYLAEPAAQALRAELLARAAGLDHQTPEAPEAVIAHVPLKRLVVGQALSAATLIGLPVLLGLVVVAAVIGEWSLLGLTVPLALSIVPMIARSVIVHFDFTIAESPDGLRLRSGLLETRAQTVPPGRVQAVRIVQPLLWRRRGWCKVEINVAGYAGDDQSKASVLLPVAPLDEAHAVLQRVLPHVDLRAMTLYGVAPGARWCDPLGWRFESAGADERVFVARRGRWRRETDIVPHERVQSARITQGPLQRRLDLATVHLDTTPGPVHVTAAHRGAAEARRILDAEVAAARTARAVAPPERWMSRPEPPAAPTLAG